MKPKITYFLLLLVFFSCSKHKEPKPKNLLDRETMTNLFYDMHMLESVQGFIPRILNENKIKPKDFLYKKYKIDSLDFVQNNRYYASNVALYKRMFDDANKRIIAEKESIQWIITEEEKAKVAAAKKKIKHKK